MQIAVGAFFFVVLELLGYWLLNKSLSVYRLIKAAQSWPSVKGTVLETTIEEQPGRNAIGNINVAYRVCVKYEYIVNEQTYQGNRVSFGAPVFDYIKASSAIEQFKEGKKTTVWYDPEKPQESVLAPKTTVGIFSRIPGGFLMASGVLVLASTIYLTLVAR